MNDPGGSASSPDLPSEHVDPLWQDTEVVGLDPDAHVICLGIADPFNQDPGAYTRTWSELEAVIPEVLELD